MQSYKRIPLVNVLILVALSLHLANQLVRNVKQEGGMKYGIFILTLFFLFSCDDNPTKPKEEDPPQVSDEWLSVGKEIDSQVIEDLAVDPFAKQTIYVATIQGFFKSTDGAKTWQNLSSGLNSTYILCIAVDPIVPNRLVIGTKSDGLYLSNDGGSTWKNAWFERTDKQVISVHIATDGMFWAGTVRGLFYSKNQGETWMDGKISGRVDAVITHPQDPNKVWCSKLYKGIYFSSDKGNTWQLSNSGIKTGSFGYDHALKFVFNPHMTSQLYACMVSGDVCKSSNLGESWISIRSQIHWQHINSIWYDPDHVSEIWAATKDNGVYRSLDDGQTWSKFGEGIDGKELTAIKTINTTDRAVIVGSEGKGLYKHVVSK
jgi:photosystem II stability/assembly factor-like uncharacterized protein